MEYAAHYDSPVGRILLTATEEALTGLWLPGCPHDAQDSPGAYTDRAAFWLDRYFAGENPDPREIPLNPAGTAFRRLVWEILRDVPYGRVTSYGMLAGAAARRMGKDRMSARAVGGAVGHNPISILIPCHRVIGGDGNLVGYGGGMENKIFLLALEQTDRRNFYIPDSD